MNQSKTTTVTVLLQKRPFVHNSVCPQFLEGVFAILFEVLLIEIQQEIHHFAGWTGGFRGTKIVSKHFVNKLAFPMTVLAIIVATTCWQSGDDNDGGNNNDDHDDHDDSAQDRYGRLVNMCHVGDQLLNCKRTEEDQLCVFCQ